MILLSEALKKNILSLDRFSKKIIVIIIDLINCVLCTWFAYVLRLEELIYINELYFLPTLLSAIIAIPLFWIFGLYKTIFRVAGGTIILNILLSTFVYGIFYFSIIGIYGVPAQMKQIGELVPRSIGIIQPMLLFFAVLISRLLIKYLLTIDHSLKNKKKNVLIYGAGSAGQQLVIALENNPEFKVIGFLDDDKKLESRVLFGKTIYSSEALRKIIKIKDINIVFLAIPSISRNKRSQIIQKLNKFKLTVKTLPSISQIIDGRITFSDIEDFNIEDLLNREQVEPNHELLKKNINFKSVLVTGAGGSIGSELCRQIIRLQPEKLILIELNEFALYEIYEQLLKIKKNVKVVPLLLNTLNQEKLKIVFETFKVDTIYHAAA